MAVSGIITVMERAARKAGTKLRRDFGEIEHLQVSQKGPADFVSKADQAAERTLYDELGRDRPGWGFVLEEGGIIEGEPGKPRFIIDPLDGTSNFLHAIPHFAISIAVQEPKPGGGWGDVTAALVYQPVTDESYWAERGRGAWLHDRRLRVASRRHLNECLISTGIPYMGHGNMAQWSRIFGASVLNGINGYVHLCLGSMEGYSQECGHIAPQLPVNGDFKWFVVPPLFIADPLLKLLYP